MEKFNWTERRKNHLRAYWSSYFLKFLDDGTVLGSKNPKAKVFGILYTPKETIEHLKVVELYED